MFVCCECCVLSGRGLCDRLSLIQRIPTDCGASLCVIKKPREWGGQIPLRGCENTTTMGCNGRKTNKQTYHASVNEIGSYWVRTLCTLHCSALVWRWLLISRNMSPLN